MSIIVGGSGGGAVIVANPAGDDGTSITRISINGKNFNIQGVAGATVYKGAWAAGAFKAGDIVLYNSNFYIRNVAGTDGSTANPVSNTTDWKLLTVIDTDTVTYKGDWAAGTFKKGDIVSHGNPVFFYIRLANGTDVAADNPATNTTDWVRVTMTPSAIKTAYESNANTNAFTDALKSKLDDIEENATADQSDTEIKTAYENNADTNALTDILLEKLQANLPKYKAATTYADKAMVVSSEIVWVSKGDGNQGNAPSTDNGTNWVSLIDFIESQAGSGDGGGKGDKGDTGDAGPQGAFYLALRTSSSSLPAKPTALSYNYDTDTFSVTPSDWKLKTSFTPTDGERVYEIRAAIDPRNDAGQGSIDILSRLGSITPITGEKGGIGFTKELWFTSPALKTSGVGTSIATSGWSEQASLPTGVVLNNNVVRIPNSLPVNYAFVLIEALVGSNVVDKIMLPIGATGSGATTTASLKWYENPNVRTFDVVYAAGNFAYDTLTFALPSSGVFAANTTVRISGYRLEQADAAAKTTLAKLQNAINKLQHLTRDLHVENITTEWSDATSAEGALSWFENAAAVTITDAEFDNNGASVTIPASTTPRITAVVARIPADADLSLLRVFEIDTNQFQLSNGWQLSSEEGVTIPSGNTYKYYTALINLQETAELSFKLQKREDIEHTSYAGTVPGYLPLSGGELTGPLTVPQPENNALSTNVATVKFVEDRILNYRTVSSLIERLGTDTFFLAYYGDHDPPNFNNPHQNTVWETPINVWFYKSGETSIAYKIRALYQKDNEHFFLFLMEGDISKVPTDTGWILSRSSTRDIPGLRFSGKRRASNLGLRESNGSWYVSDPKDLQVQPDWDQNDRREPDYINNKPNIPSSWTSGNDYKAGTLVRDPHSRVFLVLNNVTNSTTTPAQDATNFKFLGGIQAYADSEAYPAGVFVSYDSKVYYVNTAVPADNTTKPDKSSSFTELGSGSGGGSGEANVQSDWDQTDDTADDFIKNKPTSLPGSGGSPGERTTLYEDTTETQSGNRWRYLTLSRAPVRGSRVMILITKATGTPGYRHPIYIEADEWLDLNAASPGTDDKDLNGTAEGLIVVAVQVGDIQSASDREIAIVRKSDTEIGLGYFFGGSTEKFKVVEIAPGGGSSGGSGAYKHYESLPDPDDFEVNDLIEFAGHSMLLQESHATADTFSGTTGTADVHEDREVINEYVGIANVDARDVFAPAGLWNSNPGNEISYIMERNGTVEVGILRSAYRTAKGSNEATNDNINLRMTINSTTETIGLQYVASKDYTADSYGYREGIEYLVFAGSVTGGGNFVLQDEGEGQDFTCRILNAGETANLFTHTADTKHWILYHETDAIANEITAREALQKVNDAIIGLNAVQSRVRGLDFDFSKEPKATVTIDGDTVTDGRKDPAWTMDITDVEAQNDILVIEWENFDSIEYTREHALPGSTDAAGRMYIHLSDELLHQNTAYDFLGRSVNPMRVNNGDGTFTNVPTTHGAGISIHRTSTGFQVQITPTHAEFDSSTNVDNLQPPANFSMTIKLYGQESLAALDGQSLRQKIDDVEDDVTAVSTQLGGFTLEVLTEAQYTALATKDPKKLYFTY